MSATVLLSSSAAPPDAGSPGWGGGSELRRLVTATGFTVADHTLGSPPAVDLGPVVVAVIEVGDSHELAAAQTRRWRAELGDRFLPVMWVAPPETIAAGLDAGADVVLGRPVEPAVFVAQLRALARAQSTAARAAIRANEARLLGAQLRKALAQLDREQELARRVRATFLPRAFPTVGGARFNLCCRSRSGSDFHDVRRLDEQHVGFFVGDVAGSGASGHLLGVLIQQWVVMKEIGELSYRIIPPDEVLTAVNRHLLALGTDDLPLAAMLVGVLNAKTGAIALARAGLPAAVHVPATDNPNVWNLPGPFLGTADTTYQSLSGMLAPGDRLLIGTDGTRPDGDPGPSSTDRLLEAAAKHRTVGGPGFIDAVARELLQSVRHADDFTLLCVEMRREGT
jgi:serine phosphatase RsbU (regulator of sigma subunit)